MDDIEKYQFDLNGYLLVKRLINAEEVARYLRVVDTLEVDIASDIDKGPRIDGFGGISYRFDKLHQCHSYKNNDGGGLQFVVDDFLNASDAFDSLVGHAPTMEYVEELSPGPHWISSSELRYRYQRNLTTTHMGGRVDTRNRYEFAGMKMLDAPTQSHRIRDFNLSSVRVLYALHDIPVANGPLCVVPGSHKSNYFSPYDGTAPVKEPGMIPIPMDAGDAIIFTENLRHGGFPNLTDQPRKTFHLFYSPRWALSQSPIHWDDKVYVSQEAWARYSSSQRSLLPAPTGELSRQLQVLEGENRSLRKQNDRLKADNDGLERENIALKTQSGAPNLISKLRKIIGG